MALKLSWEVHRLHLRHTFTISRGSEDVAERVAVAVECDGVTGQGEAAPSGFYHQDTTSCLAALQRAAEGGWLGDDPFAVEDATERLRAEIPDQPATIAALDAALHDWVGKRLGAPVWRLLGLRKTKAGPTSFTIGIDTTEAMVAKVREAAGYPILKVKLGTDRDLEIVQAIRGETDAVIRVDANCAWSAGEAIARAARLAELGVEFIEQPCAPDDHESLRRVTEAGPLPILADESCQTLSDIPRLAGVVSGINIKLCKCGGIREALRMIHAARACGLKTMLGCMIESTLGIAAAAQLAPLVDYADLDGHLLITDDPYEGLDVVDGQLILADAPGLGVRPRA
jgi:L-alanine-DL-glutamate epimerase-like enolase superfamily enzyme